MYSPAWPHRKILEVFQDIFFVMGTNMTTHEGVELQHSRNMIIVRHNEELSLINTVRLTEDGLKELDTLGTVKNIVRIGAFHGRDDAFYLDHYPQSKLWALNGMTHDHARATDTALTTEGPMPFPDCSFYIFETSRYPEGILHIAREGGILITCDSIKNWVDADEFFSETTAADYRSQGFFGKASLSSIWLNACGVTKKDFDRLLPIQFQHLLSAHGEPLLDKAEEALSHSLAKIT